MHNSSLAKAALLAFLIVLLAIAGWEFYLRKQGNAVSYDDMKELWADKRAMVYEPSDKATVFIGSSRNKFDLDVKTWEKMTGEKVVQLAIEGTCPLPVLSDLANDPKFKGKLMIDVTEGLFFNTSPQANEDPLKRIAYYKDLTPAQRFSFQVNKLLESKLVFLDKESFSLNAMLDRTRIPSRPGVFVMPIFPRDFGLISFDRQNIMTDRFIADTNMQNQVKGIWNFFRSLSKEPPVSGAKLDSLMNLVKSDVNKIKARGGQVIFVRTPSSGPFLMGETMGFPRPKYWDRLLQETGCEGIHFQDYPATAHMQCPEFSHLTPSDAIIYTRSLVETLQKEKNWVFPHQPTN